MNGMASRICSAAWLAVAMLLVGATRTHAVDDFRPFLEALQELGYHDSAVDFLDRAAEDPRCPEDFKETIDYEAGKALIAEAKKVRAAQTRVRLQEDAKQRLQRFLEEHPEHPSAADAHAELGQLALEAGKLQLAEAEEASTDAEKQRLREEARAHIAQAKMHFDTFLEMARARAEEFRNKVVDPQNRLAAAERQEAYNNYVRARLLSVGVTYRQAHTYPPDSSERNELLEEADKQYGEIFETYGDEYLAGPYARLYQGITRKDRGMLDEAAAIFLETLTLDANVPAYQPIRNEAMANLLEVYRQQEKYAEALEEMTGWEEDTPAEGESLPTGLQVHYLAGQVALDYAESLQQEDPQAARRTEARARRHFEFASRFRGPQQLDASAKLRELQGEQLDLGEDPKSYAEAKQAGDYAWGQFTVAFAHSQDTSRSEEERQQDAEDRDRSRQMAIRCYKAALRLADGETPSDDLNQIRYRLTFLFWDAQQYYEAAVVGEYLARHQPQSVGVQKAAEIAVKAYRTLYLQAVRNGADASFERQHMESLANLIVRNWSDQPEAGEAVLMLIDTALDQGDFDGAEEYLQMLPENSPGRGRAELRLGQAIYSAYARAATADEDERPPAEELEAMRQRAQDILESGLTQAREAAKAGGQIDYSLVYSILLLSQMYLSAGDADKAAALLDDPDTGPVSLIEKNHSATANPRYQEEVYKTALRAYVGTHQFEKAEQVRQTLEELVASGGGDASSRLTQLYVSLGRQLEEHIAQLRSEGKTEQLDEVIDGFTTFLRSISSRSEGVDFRALNWVAETFLGLGKGLDPGGGELPEDAKNFYLEAAKTYVNMIKRCDEEPDFAPESLGADAKLNLQVRLAGCLRALGNYSTALELVVKVLETKETRLDAQIEAATIYQAWAEEPDKEDYYLYAIRGGVNKGGRNLVWGWGGVANRLASYYDKYADLFHEARYNLALCRMKLAQRKSGDERAELLKAARLDIMRVYQLYPSMGGSEWFNRYDALLKKIEQLQGQRMPQGLAGLKS